MTNTSVEQSHPGRAAGVSDPPVNPAFDQALDALVAVASQGHQTSSDYFNPPTEWLVAHMRIFQDLPADEQTKILNEWQQIEQDAQQANSQGKAAVRAGPEVAYRLKTGGLAFFSQLGVARRPDLTQYFIQGFQRNRDALAFSEANQALFAEILPYITAKLKERFAAGDTIVQSDRQVGDAPGRAFHARQLIFGTRYLQLPYLWRQLTFPMSAAEMAQTPDILEVSFPTWLEDVGLPDALKDRVKQAGLTQLVFKAPTKGLSLHLGFDYVGEHKMGPLTIAMFKVKQAGGVGVQAALSLAHVKTLDGQYLNTALVTVGPSLHGKSTLTIMLELAGSQLAERLKLTTDPEEGIYPMNDDIVLLQRLPQPVENTRQGGRFTVPYGIDGTENNFYAVPFGLTREDDPITYDVVRGSEAEPNPQETLENVAADLAAGQGDFQRNPVRNMRMVLSRSRLIERKNARRLIEAATNGQQTDSVHVPMAQTDRVFWQGVMRQNTVIPPLRRLNAEQYIRTLMYGEAVQMGAAIGAIGRPYVEYFSDPFIIGLEDDNANLLYRILQEMARGGQPQSFFVFNTGGVGADTNDEASGATYRKVPRDVTLMLQEALLRGAVKFEYEPVLGSEVAVAIVDQNGAVVEDLSSWLPKNIYGEAEFTKRVAELKRRRYFGQDAQDRAGILRYTKVINALIGIGDVPAPRNERELAWVLSFYWNVNQAYNTVADLAQRLEEGERPDAATLQALQDLYAAGVAQGLELTGDATAALAAAGIMARR